MEEKRVRGRRASDHSGSGLSALAIRRPVFTAMVMSALVVLGFFSYRRLPIDQFPEIDFPIVAVQTVYPGASASSVEREVTRRLEEAFNPVQDVKKITSVSLEGVSQVIVEFQLGRNVDVAAQDLRSKIDAIRRDLPDGVEPPLVQKFDFGAMPIVSIALSNPNLSMARLTALADETIRRRHESVGGVGEVRISGGLKREVRVYLQPARMEALGITVPQVSMALRSQNLDVPAGRVQLGAREQLVRVSGRIKTPEQFADIIVATRNGQVVRLGDLARIEDGTEEERSLALVDAKRAIGIDLIKVSGANTVKVADGVNAQIERLRDVLPAGTELRIVRDNSVLIRNSVTDVLDELFLGALLTVIIVMLFLNDWKATGITALSLPVSVISAFIIMQALGFTVNVLTLMALSLSIGILIDDAIVVIENIVRHREMKEDHFTAAGHGTQEIILAVMATTFSIVAVFVPVAFMGGIIGRFFYAFGLTVAWAVLVSLFVSFTLTPMLSAWWGVDPHLHGEHEGNVLTRAIAGFNAWFDRQAHRYRGVIEWALRHRWQTIGIATLSLVAAFALTPLIGGEFSPQSDESEFTVTFETPEGSSLAQTRAKAEQIIATLRAMEGVEYTYTTVGAGATGTVRAGEIYVRLSKPHERPRSANEMMMDARAALGRLYGVRSFVLAQSGPGGAQAPLQVELRGPDITELQRLSVQLKNAVEKIPGVVDVKSSLGDPKPELRVELNREAANLAGIDIGSVAATIRPLFAGEVATRWEDPTGEDRDVRLQVAPELRRSIADVSAMPVPTARFGPNGAQYTRLGDIASVTMSTAPAQIDRSRLERVVIISGSTAPGYTLTEASAAIIAEAGKLNLPPGYSVSLGGETEMFEETVGYVIETLTLAIILIFLILASQFESFTQPVAIMLSLPLSLVGVLLALLLTGSTLNIMSMIGVIMLMGLVTKNAILLVDNANERRRAGMHRFTALVEAGAVRLRPIMMTTLAMIAGMLPIALALGEGGEFRAPMARAVIGGLITSTMLTLIVIPVAYTYLDDVGEWIKRRFISEQREMEITAEQQASGLRHTLTGDHQVPPPTAH
ncbi:MAG: efflux RND transporter permease subunit [Gemmatimonadaceae bacterium]|nr:efflux RND transporter permease subunit [Gemmatimonadaceae bacterium]